MQGNPRRGAHVDASPQLGSAAQVKEQRLAAIFKILALLGRGGIKRQHFFAVLFYPQHQAKINRVVVLGERGQVGFHAQQYLLGGGILQHITITDRRIRAAQAFRTQLVLSMHQAGGQLTTGILRQRRRVVVRRGHLIIKQAERLRRGNIRGQYAISGADITHARQGNRLHQHTTDNGGDTSRKRHSHLLYSYTVFLLLLRCLSPGRRRGELTLCKSEQTLT